MKIVDPNAARAKSRRHFLRGAGVALALPWMESLPMFGRGRHTVQRRRRVEQAAGTASASYTSRRRRAGALVGEGQPEPSMEFGPVLRPWSRSARISLFVRGLFNRRHSSRPVRTWAATRTCSRARR